MQNSPNLLSFKNNLNGLLRPSPKCSFGIHDPVSIKWLYQLRVGLSPLNQHKRNHNFIDTPSEKCILCNVTEDTEHFLLICGNHEIHRNTLICEVQVILPRFHLLRSSEKVKVLLYGDNSLTNDLNKHILLETLKFLKATDRFG